MGRGASDLFGPANRFRPLEARFPDSRIIGPRLFATVQPRVRLVESSPTDRQIRRAQPDHVIFGRRLNGPGQGGSDGVDRIEAALDRPQFTQRLEWVYFVLGPRAEDGPLLVALTRRPVEHLEEPPGLGGDLATSTVGAEEAGLGDAKAAQPQGHSSTRERGLCGL